MSVTASTPRAASGWSAAALILSAALALAALGLAARGAIASGPRLAPGTEPPPAIPELALAPGAPNSALTVAIALPRTQLVGSMRPALVFSRPVVALQQAEALAQLPPPASIAPALAGSWRWLGSSAVEFVPDAPFPLSTPFTVTVPAGLRALDGSVLATAYSYGFTTPRPEIFDVQPRDGARWVEPEELFALVLNQPVAAIEDHAWIELRPDAAAPARVPLRLVRAVDVPAEEERERRERGAPGGWWSRPGDRERGLPDRRTRYELKPARPLPKDTPLALVVDGALRGEEGPLALGETRTIAMRTHGPARVAGTKCGFPYSDQCPYGPFTLLTSNELDLASLRGRVTVDPPVEIDWEASEAEVSWDGTASVSLAGAWRPGTTYRLRLAAGARDVFGQEVPAWEGTITTSDLRPTLDSGRTVALIERDAAALPLRTVNLKTVTATLWRVTPGEMARAFYDTARGGLTPWIPERAPVQSVLDVAGRRNATRWSPLAPGALVPGPRDAGLFVVQLDSPEIPPAERPERGAYRRVLVQVTDLAVHAKVGPESGLAWVTSVTQGTPVEGASVEMLAFDGTPFFRGTTDRDGLLRLPGVADRVSGAEWNPELRALVVASKDGDTGFAATGFDDSYTPWAMGMMGGWEGKVPEALGTVTPERGIYRPGDTVHFVGVARTVKLGRLGRPAAGTPVAVTLLDGRGMDVAKVDATLTPFGTFSGDAVIPKAAPLGYWSLRAALKDGAAPLEYYGSFRVEEYRAPPFLVNVKAGAADALPGDPLGAEVVARYAFGGAMAGAPVRWSALRSPLDFLPPGNPGFEFGQSFWWWDDETPRPSAAQTAAGEGLAGAQGSFGFDAGRAEAPGERPWSYTLEAEVTDVSRQRVANRATVTVHPAEAYAGVRVANEGFGEEGKPVSIRKKGAGERWETITEPVDEPAASCRVTSAETPQPCRFTPEAGGLFILEATLKDGAGRTQRTRTGLYVIGSGWVSWLRDGTDRIDLVADRALYDVGDTAQILVKSPFPAAEAIVTVERAGVMSARRVTLDGAARAIPVPIDESMVPNAYVSIVLVRGRVPTDQAAGEGADPGRPEFKLGYLELKVEKKSRRLAVTVTPERADYRPRQTVDVDLAVTDATGRPARAQLAVWAVDETVLRLTGYEAPDLLDAIYMPRPLSVRTAEPLVDLVLRRWYGEKGGTAPGGGGGDDGGELRSRFRTTVLFAPEVVTGADGRAHVAFELPDNLTTYRVMALAIGEDERFGTGKGSLTVSKPLLAIPALPRVARVGDRFEAGVVVHAKDAAALGATPVEVSAEATGGVALSGPAMKSVRLPDGRAQEVRFAFVGTSATPATLRFTVRGAGERDAVEQALVVAPSAAPEVVATYGDTEGERTETIVPPQQARPDAGGLELTLASSALAGFDGAMRQLVDYPYGCAEQIASRLVPFVALRQIQRAYGLAPTGAEERERQRAREASWFGPGGSAPDPAGAPADPDAVVADAIAALAALQRDDGGFRYWPSSAEASPWASAWVVLALARAREAGYAVEPAVIANGQRYLAETIAAGGPVRALYASFTPTPDDRAFALWVLARSGAPRASYHADLFELRARLTLASRAMLADAMLRPGAAAADAARGRELLASLVDAARITAGEAFFQDSDRASFAAAWSSDVTTTAIVLMLLETHAPEHPLVPMLVRWLAGRRQPDGGYRTTQESGWTLLALADLVATRERAVPDFAARAALGGTEIAAAEFRGRSLELTRRAVPMAELARAGRSAPLVFSKQGTGILYYGVRLTWLPERPPTTALDRGLVVQRWLSPWGARGQARAFGAGALVTLTVRVATPQERRFVAVDVPVPAGFEAVDASLATASRSALLAPPGPEGESPSIGGMPGGGLPEWAYGDYTPFGRRELRDDRVLAFADQLPPGVWEARFVLRATTPGTFLFPPATASEMYRPETFGRDGALEVTVTP